VAGKKLAELLVRELLPFIFVLLLLLPRVPCLLAVGANNLAAQAVIPEWKKVSRELGLLRCKERLESSAAAQYTAAALRWHRDYERALVNQGKVAWLEGDCPGAQANWEQALWIVPEDATTAFWLFWASGADPDRLPESLPAAALAEYAYKAGLRAEKAKVEDAAVAWYGLSLDLSPSREVADRLTRLYRQEERLEEAVAAWQRVATNLSWEDPDHWWALGQMAELKQDWAAAADDYRQAAQLESDPHDSLIRQGLMFQNQREMAAAERAYQQALEARPDLIDSYMRLGHLARMQKNYGTALMWYRQVDAVQPTVAEPQHFQGLVFFEQRDFATARQYFEVASHRNPNSAGSFYYLALCMYEMGDKAQAINTMAQAIEVYLAVDYYAGQPWDWAVTLGDWFAEGGDILRAKAVYQQALDWRPGNEDIQRRMNRLNGD